MSGAGRPGAEPVRAVGLRLAKERAARGGADDEEDEDEPGDVDDE